MIHSVDVGNDWLSWCMEWLIDWFDVGNDWLSWCMEWLIDSVDVGNDWLSGCREWLIDRQLVSRHKACLLVDILNVSLIDWLVGVLKKRVIDR